MDDASFEIIINEIIRKCGSKWCLYTKSKKNGKRRRLGSHSSRAGAERQERAIRANESVIDRRDRFRKKRVDDLKKKLQQVSDDLPDAFKKQEENEKIVNDLIKQAINDVNEITSKKRMMMACPLTFSDDEWGQNADVFDVIANGYNVENEYEGQVARYVKANARSFKKACDHLKKEVEEIQEDAREISTVTSWENWAKYTQFGFFASSVNRFCETVKRLTSNIKEAKARSSDYNDPWVVRAGSEILTKDGDAGSWKIDRTNNVMYFERSELVGWPTSAVREQIWTFERAGKKYAVRDRDLVLRPTWKFRKGKNG